VSVGKIIAIAIAVHFYSKLFMTKYQRWF